MPSRALPESALSPEPVAEASQLRFWNKVARRYARDPIADMGGYERTLLRVQSLLAADAEVLEIGCGTGTTALRLAPGVKRLLATDVSTEMIAIAREKLALDPKPQIEFRVADAGAPLAAPGSFDAVLAFNVLHLVDDLPGALRSALDALKPGGLFISKTPCLLEMNPLIPRLALPLMRAFGMAPPVACFNADQLQEALARQGLHIVGVEWHATRRKDFRPFIVARKPLDPRPPVH